MNFRNARPQDIEEDEDYTLKELAKILDCSVVTLYRAITEGKLPARWKSTFYLVRGRSALRFYRRYVLQRHKA